LTGAPLRGARRVNRRGDTARGLAATVVMLVAALGIPAGLLFAFGNPLPASAAASVLHGIISSEFIVDVVVCVVWIAWAQFTACLVSELVAGLRGSGLPRRIPLAGAQQDLARRLVTAVLLLATAAHGLHSAPGPGGVSERPGVGIVNPIDHAIAGVGAQTLGKATAAAAQAGGAAARGSATETGTASGREHAVPAGQSRAAATKEYVVMPPQGRHHDSLWDIAHRYLGSGARYKEIYELNKGRLQPDGQRLTLENLIRPGWTLILPADAHGDGLIEVSTGAASSSMQTLPPPPTRAQTTASPSGGQAAAHHGPAVPTGSAAQPAPGLPAAQPAPGLPATQPVAVSGQLDQPGATAASRDGTNAHVVGAPAGPAASALPSGTEARAPERSPNVPWDIVGAELLAAGVLEALIAMRRRRKGGRRVGSAVPGPDAAAAGAEVAVRLGADAGSADFVDHALRALAAGLAEQDRAVPEIFAARLTPERLELMLAVPQQKAPLPFVADDDGAVWSVGRDASLPAVDGVTAPLPGLVSIGGDGTGRVFVDLEAAGGPICVHGDPDVARSVVAAAAVELVTNRWSDDMRVTLVGFGGALAPIDPGRLRCAATLDDALDDITDRLSDATQAMSHAGVESVLTGRVKGSGAYPPEFVVLAAPPNPDALATLRSWARTNGRSPIGVLIAGDVDTARWRFDVGADGILEAGVLGLRVGAQQLSPGSYAAIARLIQSEAAAIRASEAPAPPAVVPQPDLPVAQRTAVHPVLPRPVDPAATKVLVRIFGEPAVDCAELPPGTPLAIEIVTFVALHGEVSPRALAGAVWPYGVTQAERDAAIGRAAEWLGTAPDGDPRLRLSDGGRLTLSPDVALDWHLFIELSRRDDDASVLDGLGYARGPLAEPRAPRRYAWLARDAVSEELPAYTVDIAHGVAADYLDRGEYDGAAAATKAGLRVDPRSRELWDQLVAAVRGRDGAGAAAVVEAARDSALRGDEERELLSA